MNQLSPSSLCLLLHLSFLSGRYTLHRRQVVCDLLGKPNEWIIIQLGVGCPASRVISWDASFPSADAGSSPNSLYL